MKKNIYTLLFMAVALFSATAFISCSKDEKGDEPKPQEEKYVAYQYWLSNDVLDIVDIEATGISNIAFTQSTQVQDGKKNKIDGKACRVIELTGDQVSKTNYSINIKMKENWKEILGTKTQIQSYRTYSKIEKKGATMKWQEAVGGKIDLNELGEERFKELVLIHAFHRTAE